MDHRLELALAEAFHDTELETIDNMLLRIFYMYQKGPKKLKRNQGTSWNLQRSNVYLRKLESNHQKHHEHTGYPTNTMPWKCVSVSGVFGVKSLKGKDCAKLKGYLNEWKKPSISLLIALSVDLLEIPPILSLSF